MKLYTLLLMLLGTNLMAPPVAYVAINDNNAGNTVTPIYLTTNMPDNSSITVDLSPNFIAITPDQTTMYVTNFDGSITGSGSVSVINIPANTLVTTITSADTAFVQPQGIVITPNGDFAYVGNAFSNTVSVIASGHTLCNHLYRRAVCFR